MNTIPNKANFSKRPEKSDQLAYGKYIYTAAFCVECHTQKEKGSPIEGMELAGGFEFPLPNGGIVRSSNITPDKETGIGSWTEMQFLSRFKYYADSSYVAPSVRAGTFNTVMPWTMYANMEEDDLKALFLYLQNQKAISNKVEKFTTNL